MLEDPKFLAYFICVINFKIHSSIILFISELLGEVIGVILLTVPFLNLTVVKCICSVITVFLLLLDLLVHPDKLFDVDFREAFPFVWLDLMVVFFMNSLTLFLFSWIITIFSTFFGFNLVLFTVMMFPPFEKTLSDFADEARNAKTDLAISERMGKAFDILFHSDYQNIARIAILHKSEL